MWFRRRARTCRRPPDLDVLGIRPGARGQAARIGLEVGEARALDAAGHAGEAQRHDLVGQADDLEQLRAAIAADGADAHLRQDLQQALLDAAAVAATQFGRLVAALALERAAAAQRRTASGRPGRDTPRSRRRRSGRPSGAVARAAGFDDQVGSRSAGRRRTRWWWIAPVASRAWMATAAGRGVAVRQQQQDARRVAPRPRPRRTGAASACCSDSSASQVQVNSARSHRRTRAATAAAAACAGDSTGELSMHLHARCRASARRHCLRGPICVASDITTCSRKRIDRRIGDLREGLAEVVVQRTHMVRQHRAAACRRPSSRWLPARSRPARAARLSRSSRVSWNSFWKRRSVCRVEGLRRQRRDRSDRRPDRSRPA